MLVVAVIGSPKAGGRTRVAVDAVLRGAEEEGARTRVVELADTAVPDAIAALEEADAAVVASPTYRADITSQLKALLDATPRGMAAYESGDPLRATACATVLTGASDHHFLAGDRVRAILSGFFAAPLLSPGLYLPSAAYAEERRGAAGRAAAARRAARAGAGGTRDGRRLVTLAANPASARVMP